MPRPEIVRNALGNMKLGKTRPIWLDTISSLYPPITFSLPDYIKKTKAGKTPKPPKIIFAEDKYRAQFFRKNKTELWRPITLDERRRHVQGDIESPDT